MHRRRFQPIMSTALNVRPALLSVPDDKAEAIVQAGRRLDALGWVPAIAGNISVRLDAERIAITRSGVHKGFLSAADVIVVGLDGAPLSAAARPSAETLLRCQLYARFPDVGAVLHGHSVPGTVLSRRTSAASLRFEGYEVQKVFRARPPTTPPSSCRSSTTIRTFRPWRACSPRCWTKRCRAI